jgi:dipeptidyl aminopeptidase/acylaminoacyl peptidase
VVVLGQEADRPLRLWLLEREGKTRPRAIGPEAGFSFFAVSPDGGQVATSFKPGTVTLLPVDKGEVREIANLPTDLVVGSWNGDRGLFLVRSSVSFPCEVHRLDLVSGKVEPWKSVAPADATGISQCAWMNLSADGKSYAYGYFRSLADVILAEGLR